MATRNICRRAYWFVLACAGLFLIHESAQAQSKIDQNAAWIRGVVDSTLKAENVPALSLGIVQDGRLVFSEGFGTIDRESNKEVDGSTIYQIGSDSKKLTAIIAKNLALEGLLDFDEPIGTYLGSSITEEAHEKLKGVTMRLLLQHRAGVPYRPPTNRRVDGDPMLIPYSEKDLLNDLNNLVMRSEPGTDSGYSNFGFAIAGYICERASGESYAVLLQKYLAEELELTATIVDPSEKQIPQIAIPYRKDDRLVKSQRWNMGKMTPAGGVFSNINDSATLMIAQLDAYRRFEEVSDKGHPLILTDPHEEEGRYYGFGLGKTVYEYGTRYGHGGDLDGFASAYMFSPKQNGGLIFFTTSGGRWVGRLESQLHTRLFGEN